LVFLNLFRKCYCIFVMRKYGTKLITVWICDTEQSG
jgi:hypothetical protein